MKKQVNSFAIHQSSKVIALIYTLIFAIIMVLYLLFLVTTVGFEPALLGLLIAPFLYGIVIYIMTAIALFLYNTVAKSFGGIEVDISSKE